MEKDHDIEMEDEEDWDVLEAEVEEIDDIEDYDEDDLESDEDPTKGKLSKYTGKNRKGANGKGRKKEKKKTGKTIIVWTARLMIVLMITALLFLPGDTMDAVREETGLEALKNLARPYRNFPEWTNVTMEMTYEFTIRGGKAEEVIVKNAPPFDIPDGIEEDGFVIQDVYDVNLEPLVGGPEYDYNNEKNIMTWWKLEDTRGNYNFTATYSATLHSYEWEIDEEDSGTIADIPQDYKERYLKDAWAVLNQEDEHIDHDQDGILDYRYHPGHPEVKRIASNVTEDEETVLGKVKEIYEWIRENLHYTTPSERERDQNVYGQWPKYPSGCLRDGWGDCDDQSLLMASMCRSVGIPAWLEIGYLYDPREESWGGHGWFNVYIPLKESVSDLNFTIAPIDPVNEEFLFRDPYRITNWIDSGQDVMNMDGEPEYNLDYYYSYYSDRKDFTVVIDKEDPVVNSLQFEEHGNIKQYMDHKIGSADLPGSTQQIDLFPIMGSLIAVPLSALAIIPFIRRKRG